jgi:ppGpp synthetase/RelA/SpoT-type nucleotidyltranferase
METLSKTKIDRLGDRLRKGSLTDDDLRLLDEYRRSFAAAYNVVATAIRSELGLEPTGRPAKSTTSITEKLQRESIRLTQMQDVAGCRLVVTNRAEQDRVVTALTGLFTHSTVVDRRENPSHGYRAVHVIVVVDQRAVEVQVRTVLQQGWAEISEKGADLADPAIKYGGGDAEAQRLLSGAADKIASFEEREHKVLRAQRKLDEMSQAGLTEEERAAIIKLQDDVASLRAKLGTARENAVSSFRQIIEDLQE